MLPPRQHLRLLHHFLGLLALGWSGIAWAAEEGMPEIDLFSAREYLEHNQTWGAVQDRAGTLYVGNKDLVLTYDGHTWGSIATGGTFVRGLAIDAEDRIWIAAVGEFGYLEANDHGGRDYVSLREHLPATDQGTLTIFQCIALPHGIYLVAENNVLRWHDGQLTELLKEVVHGWVQDGELWTQGPGLPVRAFDGQSSREVIGPDVLGDKWFLFGARHADGSTLLFSRGDGILRWQDGTLSTWPNALDATLREAKIQTVRQLRDGGFAIATWRSGCFLLDAQGHLTVSLTSESGAPQTVHHTNALYEDRAGDLWLLQNSGLARVARPAHVTRFDPRRGLAPSTVRAITRHRGRLYAGTNNGLFVLRPARIEGPTVHSARFEPIKGAGETIWALASTGDGLLMGGRGGLRVLTEADDGDFNVTFQPFEFTTALWVSPAHPGSAWLGHNRGLSLFQNTGTGWTEAGTVPEIAHEVRAIVEDADGALWVAVAGRGYYRISQPTDPQAREVQHFPGGHGLPSPRIDGLPGLALRDGHAVFLDQSRLFSFDATRDRFEPLITGNIDPAPPGLHMPTLATSLDDALWVRTLRSDPEAGPWGGRVFWRLPRSGPSRALPFFAADSIGENPVFFEEATPQGSVVWIGGSEGLVRAELPAGLVEPRPFRVSIRLTQDLARRLSNPAATPPALPYRQQEFAFVFGTDRLDDRRMRYQWRLSDLGASWSPLTATATLSLNYLPAGTHRLEARARDANGRLSETGGFTFVVLPPWWQTWWARLGGSVLLGFALVVLVRHRLGVVQRRNAQLESLVAERTRALQENEAQLTEARDAADAANRAKSDFLASMSHELRTPLNAILGFAQILLRETGLSAKGRVQLETVGRNGRHLLEMINEVLDLSKIEANQLTLRPVPCSLRRLATELAGTFEPRAAEKGLNLRLELSPGTARIMVDESKLRQVLINLLGNAIKFTRTGEIVLAITRRDDRVHFEVRDTGIGIGREDQAAVFEPFRQSRHTPGRAGIDGGGTGLGLPISQRLVRLMGGHIAVESEPGAGSRFYFDLTVHDAAAEMVAEAPVRITGYEGPVQRVLIVDDIETNRTILHEFMSAIGFETVQCANGRDALARHAQQPFDLVLLDLRLPDLSGEEVARQLRPAGQSQPRLIAISASVFELGREHADLVGCDAFVPKPVDESELLGVIGAQLRLRWKTTPAPSPGPDSSPAFNADQTDDEIVQLPLPSAVELRAWWELARRGDQRRLREAINASAAKGPDAAFRHALDRMLRRFRTGQVRDILARVLPASASTAAAEPTTPSNA